MAPKGATWPTLGNPGLGVDTAHFKKKPGLYCADIKTINQGLAICKGEMKTKALASMHIWIAKKKLTYTTRFSGDCNDELIKILNMRNFKLKVDVSGSVMKSKY